MNYKDIDANTSLEVQNLIDNFIKDMEALTDNDTVIGVSVINDSLIKSYYNTTTAYLPLIILSFYGGYAKTEKKCFKAAKTLIKAIINQGFDTIPELINYTYKVTLKNDPNKQKEI